MDYKIWWFTFLLHSEKGLVTACFKVVRYTKITEKVLDQVGNAHKGLCQTGEETDHRSNMFYLD